MANVNFIRCLEEKLNSIAVSDGQFIVTTTGRLFMDFPQPMGRQEIAIAKFVGTQEQYNTAYALGSIQNGTIVIITDELPQPPTDASTTAKLGSAILGKMILGTS